MSEPRQIANLMRDALNALYKRRTRQVPGLIGDGTTEERVIVTGATQRVWFRPDPYPNALWQPIHLSGDVPLLHGMAAIVEFNETDGEWYVQQIDRKKYAEQESLDLRYLPAHASQHVINEDSIPSDPVWVYRRAMAMLRGSPPGDGTLRVYVQSGDLPYTASPYFSGAYTADLTSYLPSAGNQKWLTISITSAAAIDINAGSEFTEGLSGINAPPDADDGAVPICHVLLSDDTSTITEAEIWDARRTVGLFANPLSFANPTASVGLSAVNGSAGTAMRSDAAPALDQSIAPTWTGVHTHQNTVDLNGQTLILDADGDTSITADTDDQIDFEVAGSDVLRLFETYLDLVDDAMDIRNGSALSLYDDWLGNLIRKAVGGDFTSFAEGALPSIFNAWTTTPAQNNQDSYYGHFGQYRASAAQSGVTCFLYTNTVYDSKIALNVFPENNSVDAGLRFDNGSDDTFLEFFVRSGVGTYTSLSCAFFMRYQEGSGGITTTQLSDEVPPRMLGMQIATATAFPLTSFYLQAGTPPQYVTTRTYSGSWTPTRCGLFVRNNTGSGDRGALFHSFAGDSR